MGKTFTVQDVRVDKNFKELERAIQKVADATIDESDLDHNKLKNTHNLTTDIDHDALTNFVANEHIDYTSAIDNTNKVVKTSIKARAFMANTQENIPDGVATLVEIGNETYDIGGNYNTSTYCFVVPVTGYYLICAAIRWDNIIDNKRYYIIVMKNESTQVSYMANSASNSTYLSSAVSDVQYLEAGDYIRVFAYHVSGVSTPDIAGGTHRTFLAMHLLSV